jgi:hypothetical protein
LEVVDGNIQVTKSSGSALVRTLAGTVDLRQYADAGGTGYGGTISAHPFSFLTSNTPRIYIEATGNVGIGTTGPSAKLDIGGALTGSAEPQELRVSNASGRSAFRVGQDNTHNAYWTWFYDATPANAYLGFGTYGGTNPFVFFPSESAGKVGFYTTTPRNLVDINGAVAIGSYAGVNTAPSNGMIISGNVGIGTTGPDTKLDVNGALTIREKSADPADPDEGSFVMWMSDGTGTGDDGDILIKIQAGGVVKTTTLVDFSAI